MAGPWSEFVFPLSLRRGPAWQRKLQNHFSESALRERLSQKANPRRDRVTIAERGSRHETLTLWNYLGPLPRDIPTLARASCHEYWLGGPFETLSIVRGLVLVHESTVRFSTRAAGCRSRWARFFGIGPDSARIAQRRTGNR